MNMRCRLSNRALVAAASLLFTHLGFANAVTEFSLEEKVRRSDIVFIGHVVSITDHVCYKEFACADVQFLEVLKGKKIKTVRVLWGSPITEFNPACCEVGKNYLFFLKRRRGDFFETVNAYHGVYELPKRQGVDNSFEEAASNPGK
jgi:hypothetical protein